MYGMGTRISDRAVRFGDASLSDGDMIAERSFLGCRIPDSDISTWVTVYL